jgi:uncharacterized protein (TIGR02145 family)
MKTSVQRLLKFGVLFIMIVVNSSLRSEAQYVITRDVKTAYDNDSVILFMNNIRGEVHWESSGDLTVWDSLAGQTHDTLAIHVDHSSYYRAVIKEGTCATLYSDTVLIAELYDDRDRQFYDVVKIGNQWWMAENLNYDAGSGSYFYNGNQYNGPVYGRLYSWPAASISCPSGWHLPSDREWMILETTLGTDPAEVENSGWRGTGLRAKLEPGGTTGFDLVYAGFRAPEQYFDGMNTLSLYWTSGIAENGMYWYRGLNTTNTGIHRTGYADDYSFSVRCVKNNTPVLYTDSVSGITDTSVVVHGTFFDGQGSAVTAMGACWDTQSEPTYNGNHMAVDAGDSTFFVAIPYLSVSTTYYVRTYAINASGIGYGNTLTFSTHGPVPLIYTTPATSVTTTAARSGGNIANSKGLQITGRGVCWSTHQTPTVNDSKTSNGAGTGSYVSDITGLTTNTPYYIRAYVTTPAGNYYGNEISMETLAANETGTANDSRDGKTYKTVKIGFQWWMAQNLDLYTVVGSSYYENDSVQYAAGGRLYNVIMAQNVCIPGWHLPSEDEWKLLETTLGMDPAVLDNTGWRGTDEGARLFKGAPDGFDAEFGGLLTGNGTFYGYNTIAAYWSSTQYESSGEYWYRGINSGRTDIHRDKYGNPYMHSVRCIKNDKPYLVTDSVGSIGEASAAAYSRILSNGGRSITARGVCWSKSSGPTTSNSNTMDGTGNSAFSSEVTGLDQNTTYYLRAYATNDQGTSYGNEITFITNRAFPVVTTSSVSGITSTTASGGGNVTNSKGFSITARGVCWNTLPAPTTANAHTTNGTGTGVFTSSITGLQPNTKYYVRAYATSGAGTGYGNEVSFRTSYQYPTGTFTDARDGKVYTTIIIGDQLWMAENLRYNRIPGSAYYNNDSVHYYQYGRMYNWQAGMNSCPAGWHLPTDDEWKTLEMAMGMSTSEADGNEWRGTTEAYKLMEGGTSGFEVLYGGHCYPAGNFGNEGEIGAFWSSTGSGVSNAWYRGFNISHGDIHRFEYSKDYKYSVRCLKNVLPVLTTATATGMTDTSAWSGGDITYDGGAPVTARGTCWGLSHNPTIAADTTNNGTGTGSFVSHILGLSPAKTYYARAYAINSEGTAYGIEISIVTLTGLPRVTTAAVSSITDTTAVCGGSITSNGGLSISAKGVCWSTTGNPTIANTKTSDGSGTASFTSNMVNLLPHTTYFVRAYATNTNGTGYGLQVTFSTQTSLPKVTTAAITAITDSSATGGGNVTSGGGLTVTARGVCWNTTGNPTIAGNKTGSGEGTGTFISNLTGLLPNTPYYVRAYATNSTGTGYGNQVTFTTPEAVDPVGLPELTTAAVTGITDNSAVSGGNVTGDGGAPVTVRGICWSTSPNPTVSSPKTVNGGGTGSFTANLTGLSDRTKYYVRAYAVNSAGTGYGNEQSFTTTIRTGTMTDGRDDHEYATIKIGTGWWLAENLNYSVAGSAYYGDSATYAEAYGRLYTWSAMMNGAPSGDLNPSGIQGICPAGWHIPGNTEWTELIAALGGPATAGSELKEEGTTHWASTNSDATNASGFTARPAGMLTETMAPGDVTTHAYFWTATEYDGTFAFARWLSFNSASVSNSAVGKDTYRSVRCKKD